MSSHALRIVQEAAPGKASDYLGPAEVVAASGAEIDVRLDGATVRAQLALAFPYEPVAGDTLLVIARGDACYVIGVLHGTGRSDLSLPGDVGIHAAGELHLSGAKGVKVTGPEVEVQTGKLRMLAENVTQRFASLYQRVTDMLSVHARQSTTLVDEAAYSQSKSAAIVTEGTVTINGNEIHLG
jgi:hypothetical protein